MTKPRRKPRARPLPCRPRRPPTKKLLDDNPDALYDDAVVDPAGSYRIRGNVHGTCYTYFAAEAGAMEGPLSEGVVATLNDTGFDVRADGSYEIGPER